MMLEYMTLDETRQPCPRRLRPVSPIRRMPDELGAMDPFAPTAYDPAPGHIPPALQRKQAENREAIKEIEREETVKKTDAEKTGSNGTEQSAVRRTAVRKTPGKARQTLTAASALMLLFNLSS